MRTQDLSPTTGDSKVSISDPTWLHILRRVGAVFFLSALPVFSVFMILRAQTWSHWSAILLGLFVGYIIADLLSGLVHWASDTFGSGDLPVLGCALITPFRTHHDDPDALAREDAFQVNGVNCFLSALLLATASCGLSVMTVGVFNLFLSGLVTAVSLGIPLASQIHQWVHMETPPRWVKVAQTWGLVITSEAHNQHHHDSTLNDYCIVSGWWNAPLKRIRFYRHLESFLVNRVGLKVTR